MCYKQPCEQRREQQRMGHQCQSAASGARVRSLRGTSRFTGLGRSLFLSGYLNLFFTCVIISLYFLVIQVQRMLEVMGIFYRPCVPIPIGTPSNSSEGLVASIPTRTYTSPPSISVALAPNSKLEAVHSIMSPSLQQRKTSSVQEHQAPKLKFEVA